MIILVSTRYLITKHFDTAIEMTKNVKKEFLYIYLAFAGPSGIRAGWGIDQ